MCVYTYIYIYTYTINGACQNLRENLDIHNLWKQIGRPRTGLINAQGLRIKCLYKKGIADRKHTFDNDRKKWLIYKLF